MPATDELQFEFLEMSPSVAPVHVITAEAGRERAASAEYAEYSSHTVKG